MSQDPAAPEDLDPEDLPGRPGSLQPEPTGLQALLPRFRISPSRPPTPTTPEPPTPGPSLPPLEATVPPGPSGPTTPSSTASTDRLAPPAPRPGSDDWVDPKDLQAAVGQAVDVAFVLVGQGFGTLERRARRLEAVDAKWLPTKQERELIQGPAARIAKRHIHADAAAMDTIDGCLIAAGVGSFAMRGLLGLEPLQEAQP